MNNKNNNNNNNIIMQKKIYRGQLKVNKINKNKTIKQTH